MAGRLAMIPFQDSVGPLGTSRRTKNGLLPRRKKASGRKRRKFVTSSKSRRKKAHLFVGVFSMCQQGKENVCSFGVGIGGIRIGKEWRILWAGANSSGFVLWENNKESSKEGCKSLEKIH